jgi:amidase
MWLNFRLEERFMIHRAGRILLTVALALAAGAGARAQSPMAKPDLSKLADEAQAWLTDLVDGDHASGGSSNASAVAGYPDITVPAGFISGLPVGISFFGRAWSEPTLIKIAYSFEQATKVRKPPQFLASVKV